MKKQFNLLTALYFLFSLTGSQLWLAYFIFIAMEIKYLVIH